MVVTLYLVRHGQTLFNQEGRMQGSCDSSLTKLGVKQLQSLRRYFVTNGIKFNKGYCSTQERASDSLEIITKHHLPYKRLKELKEKDYGFFEGRANILWPLHFFLNLKPPVEKNQDVVTRVERGMNLILREAQDGDCILVVGHGDSLSQYLRNVIDVRHFRGFGNASFVKLVSDGKSVKYVKSGYPARNVH